MPKIPVYQPRTPKTREVPGVRAPAEAFVSPFLELERAGKEVFHMGAGLIEAHRSTEYARHISESASDLQNLQFQFEQDEDIWTVEERATKAVEDFKQKRLGEIKDPILAREFGPAFDRLALTALGQITTQTRRRQIDYTKATTISSLETLEQAYYNAQSEPQAAAILAQMKGILVGQTKAGVFTNVEAELFWQNLKEKMVKNSVVADIMRDPESALLELTAKEYKGLDEADRLALINAAEREIKLREHARTAEEAKVAAAAKAMKEEVIRSLQNSFIGKLQTDELSVDEILKSGLDPVGAGSKDFFLKAIEDKAKASLKDEDSPWDITKGKTYHEVLEKIYADKIETEEEILDYAGKGISAKDVPGLVEKWKKHRDKIDDPTNTIAYKQAIALFKRGAEEKIFKSEEEEYAALVEFERTVGKGKKEGVPYSYDEISELAKGMLFPYKESFWKRTMDWIWGREETEAIPMGLPPAEEEEGETFEDLETGERHISDGKKWKLVK